MALRDGEQTTITVYKEDRENLRETLELAKKKLHKRRYFMDDLLDDMNRHFRKYLNSLPDNKAN